MLSKYEAIFLVNEIKHTTFPNMYEISRNVQIYPTDIQFWAVLGSRQSCSASKETTDVTVTRGMLWSEKV